MKKLLLFLTISIFIFSCENEDIDNSKQLKQDKQLEFDLGEDDVSNKHPKRKEYFMVANRGSSTISVFNAKTTEYLADITLPDEGAQPTYLAHSKITRNVYVGDFVNQKVVYYDAKTFEMKGEIAIQEGAFHMWINDYAGQLWVNNIVSKTTSVIDLHSHTVVATIPLPTNSEIEGISEGAVQHDVTISPSGYAAYVTVLDGSDKSYVVMYNTHTFEYIKHVEVGGDAHMLPVGFRLYVTSQNGNEISVLNRFNLEELDVIDFESPHGVAVSRRYFFTTGIGTNKIGVINPYNEIVSETDTDFNIPHNLAVNRRGNILFLSHSGGTATKVVFYKVKKNGTLIKLSDYDSGTNPFGVLRY